MFFFWTSRNLNVTNDKGKQTCFAKALRELRISMQVLNTSSSDVNIIILADKFVAALSSLVTIVTNCWQPFKSKRRFSVKLSVF